MHGPIREGARPPPDRRRGGAGVGPAKPALVAGAMARWDGLPAARLDYEQRLKISHERLVADSVKPGGTLTARCGSWGSST